MDKANYKSDETKKIANNQSKTVITDNVIQLVLLVAIGGLVHDLILHNYGAKIEYNIDTKNVSVNILPNSCCPKVV